MVVEDLLEVVVEAVLGVEGDFRSNCTIVFNFRYSAGILLNQLGGRMSLQFCSWN